MRVPPLISVKAQRLDADRLDLEVTLNHELLWRIKGEADRFWQRIDPMVRRELTGYQISEISQALAEIVIDPAVVDALVGRTYR